MCQLLFFSLRVSSIPTSIECCGAGSEMTTGAKLVNFLNMYFQLIDSHSERITLKLNAELPAKFVANYGINSQFNSI